MPSATARLAPYRATTYEAVSETADEMSAAMERMIRTQMEAYPQHWSDAERREMAVKHLGLGVEMVVTVPGEVLA